MEATLNSCSVSPIVANYHFKVMQTISCIKDNGRKRWITRMRGAKGTENIVQLTWIGGGVIWGTENRVQGWGMGY